MFDFYPYANDFARLIMDIAILPFVVFYSVGFGVGIYVVFAKYLNILGDKDKKALKLIGIFIPTSMIILIGSVYGSILAFILVAQNMSFLGYIFIFISMIFTLIYSKTLRPRWLNDVLYMKETLEMTGFAVLVALFVAIPMLSILAK